MLCGLRNIKNATRAERRRRLHMQYKFQRVFFTNVEFWMTNDDSNQMPQPEWINLVLRAEENMAANSSDMMEAIRNQLPIELWSKIMVMFDKTRYIY